MSKNVLVMKEIKDNLLLAIFMKNICYLFFVKNTAVLGTILADNITIAVVYIVSYLICKIGDK